jgi:hypothetical protein
MILQGLKPRFSDRLKPYAGRWMKELLLVMWALRMSQAIGQMLFSLVYGSEATLPTEVEQKSPKSSSTLKNSPTTPESMT